MKRATLIISAATIMLASCSQDEVTHAGKATMILDLTYENMPQITVTRAVSPGLSIQILTPDGTVYQEYAAGAVPDKVTLEGGVTYTVKAFTPNQDTWQTANDGRGEACYYGETTVTAIEDEVVYCRCSVPMTNYAVTFSLPDHFDELFSSYGFVLHANGKDVTLQQSGTNAYFSVDSQGFTYHLQAVNTDGAEFSTTPATYTDVQAGKMYQLSYDYDFGSAAAVASLQIHN